MVYSNLNSAVFYKETPSVDPEDVGYSSTLFEMDVLGKTVLIVLGKAKHSFIERNVVFYPIYLVANGKVKSQIGIVEMHKNKAIEILDEDGDVDVSKLSPPLLYGFVNELFIDRSGSDSELFMAEREKIAAIGTEGVAHVSGLAEFAKKRNIGLRGISFHVGSESSSPTAHMQAIRLAGDQCVKLLQAGHNANIIDIGGGFVQGNFAHQSAHIREAILEKKGAGLRFIAEPGRFFATEAQDLFVQVIGKKRAAKKDGWRYTLDESLYGQFTNILFDHQHPRWVRIPAKLGQAKGKIGSGILFGRTCDSLDVIARSDDMEELEVGDWLWFPHMGAYTTVTASEFNGFPKPPVFMNDELPLAKEINMSTSVGAIRYVNTVSAKELLS